MYLLVKAEPEDLEICYQIIDSGRNFQRAQGFTQWTDDYPNIDTIKDDIKNSKGYVVKADGVIAGYMCIDFDGEPAYLNIDGEWGTSEPYAVVHRMAFGEKFRGQGLADITFGLIDELCIAENVRSIRADTDFPNKRMQHILEKNGYIRRGIIIFQGSGKIAYDKNL